MKAVYALIANYCPGGSISNWLDWSLCSRAILASDNLSICCLMKEAPEKIGCQLRVIFDTKTWMKQKACLIHSSCLSDYSILLDTFSWIPVVNWCLTDSVCNVQWWRGIMGPHHPWPRSEEETQQVTCRPLNSLWSGSQKSESWEKPSHGRCEMIWMYLRPPSAEVPACVPLLFIDPSL